MKTAASLCLVLLASGCIHLQNTKDDINQQPVSTTPKPQFLAFQQAIKYCESVKSSKAPIRIPLELISTLSITKNDLRNLISYIIHKNQTDCLFEYVGDSPSQMMLEPPTWHLGNTTGKDSSKISALDTILKPSQAALAGQIYFVRLPASDQTQIKDLFFGLLYSPLQINNWEELREAVQ